MSEELQWVACVLGMTGALTNCLGGRVSRLTWPLWLASNIFGLAVLTRLHAHGLVAQQIFYTCTTILGGVRAYCPAAWGRFCVWIRRQAAAR
ncbi:hypothetical protein R70006_04945 [Paraburkholderia domus]|nr:hypothetical protein R70006_04945 [Paraburkholderia domus]